MRAFVKQKLVGKNSEIAKRLTEVAKLTEYEEGQVLYVQGEPRKNNLYFVIHGEMDLLVKGKPVCTILSGQAIGEFPILDPLLYCKSGNGYRVRNSEGHKNGKGSQRNRGGSPFSYSEVFFRFDFSVSRVFCKQYRTLGFPKCITSV
jgi:CRP-like cAMP-binding protein